MVNYNCDAVAVHAPVLGNTRHGPVGIDVRARNVLENSCGVDQHFPVDLDLRQAGSNSPADDNNFIDVCSGRLGSMLRGRGGGQHEHGRHGRAYA